LGRADASDQAVLKIRDQNIKKHQLSLLERKLTLQEASSRAKAGVEEAGKKLEITPDVIKQILAAVDRRLMGEA